ACAITFEDAVIAVAASTGLIKSNGTIRIFGSIWLYHWFVYSMGGLHDVCGNNRGGRFSLIMGLYRGDWYPRRK
ncbi:hypothetical protein L208DRAFT_1287413, partial [Tricholoma matsutake]